MVLVGAGVLLGAGCPVTEEMMDPEVTWYGKVKADVAMQTAQTGGGDTYVTYVKQGDENYNFAVGALDTRFGANITMGEGVTGKIEVDFHDNDVLLRHAYAKMKLGEGLYVLAGQTSDVFSPLVPGTLNWTVGWNCGNLGHRSPQVILEYGTDSLNVKASVSDPQAESMGVPDMQGRVGIKLGGIAAGVSAVVGSTDEDGNDEDETMSGLCVDFKVPLGEKIAISGELYQGQNLRGYKGNIGETAAVGDDPEVEGTGAWIQLQIKLTDSLTVKAGVMREANDGDDVNAFIPEDPAVADDKDTPAQRETNDCVFANVCWKLNAKTTAGIEVSKWVTGYKGDEEYEDLRVQASLIYTF